MEQRSIKIKNENKNRNAKQLKIQQQTSQTQAHTDTNVRQQQKHTNQIPSNFKTKQIDQSESIIFFQNGDRFFLDLRRFCFSFNSAVDLNIGFQHYSSQGCASLMLYFYYKKKYLINIGFEKIMSDPTIILQIYLYTVRTTYYL